MNVDHFDMIGLAGVPKTLLDVALEKRHVGERALVEAVCTNDNYRLQGYRTILKDTCHVDVIEDLKNAIHGKLGSSMLERLLIGLLYKPAIFDAQAVYEALRKPDADDAVATLIDHLTHRIWDGSIAQDAYIEVSGKNLEDELKMQLQGDTLKLFLTMIKGGAKRERKVSSDVELLQQVITGSVSPSDDSFIELLVSCNEWYLKQLLAGYVEAYRLRALPELAKVITDEVYLKAVTAQMTPHNEYYAQVLHDCVTGASTNANEARMVRTLISRRTWLAEIGECYYSLYNRRLSSQVPGMYSGELKRALQLVLHDV